MVFNATFNNISVISWRSVVLVEETGVLGENHWPVRSHWQTWSHNVVSSTPHHERGSNSQLSGDTKPINKRTIISQSKLLKTSKTVINAGTYPCTDMEAVLPHFISSFNYLYMALKYCINSVWFSQFYRYNMYTLFFHSGFS